jgi:hypothetical protein
VGIAHQFVRLDLMFVGQCPTYVGVMMDHYDKKITLAKAQRSQRNHRFY